jgi:hypothetical protein
MRRGTIDPELERAFEHLRQVPPPDGQRQAAHRAQFLARARRQAEAGQAVRPPLRWWRGLWPQAASAGRRALAGLVAALVVVVALGGGLAYAADGAVPGEPLYGLDRGLETVRLALAAQPEAKAQLWLSLTEERLQEAEELAQEGSGEGLQAALDGYATALSSLIEELPDPGQTEDTGLAAQMGEAVTSQEARLGAVLGATVSEQARTRTQEEAAGEDAAACSGEQIHPVAASLAEQYGLAYEEILTWFCEDGYGMGEIKLALETGEVTGMPAGELLALRTELGGWGPVWQGLGMIGRPAAGPPEGAGPSEEAGPPEGAGPPEEAGPPQGAGLPEEAGPPAEAGKETSATCSSEQVHPTATYLAEEYGVSYEEIMAWFCEDGFGMGEIMLALQTARAMEMPPSELLALKTELGGWGLVWLELGMVGHSEGGPPEEVGPPGKEVPPKKAEPPGKSDSPGRPDSPGKSDPPGQSKPQEEGESPQDSGPSEGGEAPGEQPGGSESGSGGRP